MFDAVGDLRNAWRVALKSPGQTTVMIATLAMAIGATTVGFSFADTIVLRGLPVAEPDDTVIVYAIDPRQPDRRSGVYFDDFLVLRARARSVEHMSTWSHRTSTVLHRGDAYATQVTRVAGDLFDAWGIRTRLGRGLRLADGEPGAAPVAVLASHYWERLFGASPAVVGDTILIDGTAHEIIGVADAALEFGTFASIGVWVAQPLESRSPREAHTGVVTARLAPGATVADASAELATIAGALASDHPDTNRGRTLLVLAANRAIGGPNFWIVMTLLVSAVALVMVIASANVAGILLARSIAREREFALRIALGARRVRVFRQLAIEGVLLTLAAAVSGIAVAEAGLRLIRAADAEPIFQQLAIDWHEAAFAAALALMTPLVFSLAPSLAAARTNLAAALNASARVGWTGGRARSALVMAQVAFAVMLVTVGGLVARSAVAMASAPVGFDTSALVSFVIHLPDTRTIEQRRQHMRELTTALGASGHAVGALDTQPAVSLESVAALDVPGFEVPAGEPTAWAYVIGVDEHALTTLGVPLLSGRPLAAVDAENDASVALISAELARRTFGDVGNAVGRFMTVRAGGDSRQRLVVGVTGDVRDVDAERGMPPRIWVPLTAPRQVAVVVRTRMEIAAAAEEIRRVARQVLPGVPLQSLEPYAQSVRRRGGSDRVIMGMLVTFAGVALAFAAIGLYGMVAVSSNLRRAEFATRYALGAETSHVARLVVMQACRTVAPGVVVGLGGGLLAARAMSGMLYGVTPLDPLNVVGVIGLLMLVALGASLAPAIRAARVNVIEVLRG